MNKNILVVLKKIDIFFIVKYINTINRALKERKKEKEKAKKRRIKREK